MGRARSSQKKSARAATSTQPTVASLLSKAQDLVVQCDYSLARKFTERILARADAGAVEKNQAKEILAVVLLEIGEIDDAKNLFLTLVPPHPEAPSPPPASAYLYLAQLTDDEPHTALAHYQSAIDVLQTQLKGKSISSGEEEEADDDAEIKGNIVRAYLGMVEIWMDPEYDLCVDEAASNTCDVLLSRALEIDPGNLEALQTLASVRLSQEKQDEALRALRTFPPPAASDATPDSHALLLLNALPLQTRVARAKLLLECGAYTDALALLEGVLAADDAHVEGWYLMGWAWWLLASRMRDGEIPLDIETAGLSEDGQPLAWEDMARDARDCLETCRTLHASQGHSDAPMLEHAQELVGTLDALGIQPSPAEEGEEDEWDDVSSEGDEDEDVEMA